MGRSTRVISTSYTELALNLRRLLFSLGSAQEFKDGVLNCFGYLSIDKFTCSGAFVPNVAPPPSGRLIQDASQVV